MRATVTRLLQQPTGQGWKPQVFGWKMRLPSEISATCNKVFKRSSGMSLGRRIGENLHRRAPPLYLVATVLQPRRPLFNKLWLWVSPSFSGLRELTQVARRAPRSVKRNGLRELGSCELARRASEVVTRSLVWRPATEFAVPALRPL